MLWEWDGTLERIHHELYVATAPPFALALISSLRARVARRLGAAIGIVCCFEAGRDGFWPIFDSTN